jgi:hypothetical protein
MKLKMVAPFRTKSGTWCARKCIPADIRTDFKKLYGQSFEVKLSLPASVSTPDAKAQFNAWLADIEPRIETLRASRRGEALGLTHMAARALSGEWYRWHVGKHESEPGKTDWEFEWFAIPSAASAPAEVERRAKVPEFLAERGLRLTPDAHARFLDYGRGGL